MGCILDEIKTLKRPVLVRGVISKAHFIVCCYGKIRLSSLWQKVRWGRSCGAFIASFSTPLCSAFSSTAKQLGACWQVTISSFSCLSLFWRKHGDFDNSTPLTCPICKRKERVFAVHLHNKHGPESRVVRPKGWRPDAATYAFSLERHFDPKNKFRPYSSGDLQTSQNRKILDCRGTCLMGVHIHIFSLLSFPMYSDSLTFSWSISDSFSSYWLPAGRVDPGESFQEAAIRETKEEAGIDIKLTGVLQFQYRPRDLGGGVLFFSWWCSPLPHSCQRMRVVFLGEPVDASQAPKSIPDYESQGAEWMTHAKIKDLAKRGKLRGMEPAYWTSYLEDGGPVYPLSLISAREN